MPAPIAIDPTLTSSFWSRAERQAAILGLSWKRVAIRLGLDEATLCRMRSGKLHTHFEVAVHVARELRCPALLDDALAVISEHANTPATLDVMAADSSVVIEACKVIAGWSTDAANGEIDAEEARAELARLEALEARITEAKAALEIIANPGLREVTRG